VEPVEDGPRPFKALLDVGLARTTTGCKIFGALKGAADGGIDVPHNDKRFPGTKKGDSGDLEGSAETVRKYILGGHISDFMKSLKDEDEERFNKQFKRYIDSGIKAESLEKLYLAAHKAIRADPNKKREATHLGRFKTRSKPKPATAEKKDFRKPGLSLQQRKSRIVQKLKARGVKHSSELA